MPDDSVIDKRLIGHKQTEETKRKIAEAHRGKKRKPFTDEARRNMSLAHIGKKRPPFTDEHKKKISDFAKTRIGNKNPKWRGGKTMHPDGYVWILRKNHPRADHHGYVLEHRLVMEEHLGRYLRKEEVVHHINKNTSDNRIENLSLMANQSEHAKHEYFERKINKKGQLLCQ